MKAKKLNNIYAATNNKKYLIEAVPEFSLLDSLGVKKNSVVQKKYTYGLGGPVVLKIDMSIVAIGKDVASKILVKEVA